MEFGNKKLRFRNNSILRGVIIFCSLFFGSFVWADGRNDAEFFETYTLTARERCELIVSHSPLNVIEWKDYRCDHYALFKPSQSIHASAYGEADVEKQISLSSVKNDDWSLAEVIVKTKSTSGHLIINMLSINGFGYDLSEYIPQHKPGYSAIHVGYIGEAIIIRLEHQSITQLSIIPAHCDDDSVTYKINQILSWYPPFQEDSYSKTFIKSPTCI